jgi:alanine-alpha-ketoisovalerate/valine-pyruvate aminotransferase
MPIWLRLCVSERVLRRAFYSAAIVGTLLILINYGTDLLHGSIDRTRLVRMLLTVIVPFVVSTVSSVITIMEADLAESYLKVRKMNE